MSTFEALLNSQFPQGLITPEGFWRSGEGLSPDDDWVSPLLQYDFMRIDGPDSATFLQGQTTCDWRQISATQASRGSYCNIKGRVLSSFIGLQPHEALAMLRMRGDICASTRALLQKYIVFSKAEICPQERRHWAIGVAGKQARVRLERVFGSAPQGHLQSVSLDADVQIIQLDEAGERFECWLSGTAAGQYWNPLCESATVCDSHYWERDNILAGIAEICAATQDQFLPQQLNYQLTGAVNFKKGCYTGQEVVARIQYRGKLKRRLYAARIDSSLDSPLAGELVSPTSEQSIGNIVSAFRGADHSLVLAVLTIDALEQPIFNAGSETPLHLLALPYELPEIG